MRAEPPAHVVWDWNGTLLDDLACCLQVTNQLLTEFDLPPLATVAAYQRIFRFPVVDYYADLGFDTSPDGNFKAAAKRYSQLYLRASAACELHAGAAEIIRQLHAARIPQSVISASEQRALESQLAPFELSAWLEAAHGRPDGYATTKLDLAQRWLNESGLDPKLVWFIGDSAHDHEVASSLGANCLLFSGGHHSRPHLESLGAPVLDELSQVAERLVA